MLPNVSTRFKFQEVLAGRAGAWRARGRRPPGRGRRERCPAATDSILFIIRRSQCRWSAPELVKKD